MKTLLLTVVLLGLMAGLQAQDLMPFPLGGEFEGPWYLKAIAANKNMPESMKPRKSFPVLVTPLKDGSFEIKITFFYKNRCQEKTVVLQKTQDPFKFQASQNNMVVSIEELSAKGHFIFYIEHQMFGMTIRIAKLMGNTPVSNPKALEEFKKFMRLKKLPQENIFIPEQRERCEA